MKEKLIKQLEEIIASTSLDLSKEKRKMRSVIPDYLIDLSQDVNMFLAGGAVTSVFTNKPVNDLDIYMVSKADLRTLLIDLIGNSTIISATDRGVVVHYNQYVINVIYFNFFQSAQEIFDSFDFTCVMGAYDIRNDEFILHKNFLRDVAKRELVFNPGTAYPLASLLRVEKYKEKGYTISKNSMISIILKCMTLNIDSYKELESQVGGMYGIDISKIVDTNKEFSLNVAIEYLMNAYKNIDDFGLFKSYEDSEKKLYETIRSLFKDINDNLINIKGRSFILNENKRLIDVPAVVRNILKDAGKNVENPTFKVYKFVRKNKDGDGYQSYWDDSFKYYIDEYAEDTKNGLWGGCLNKYQHFSNSNRSDRILIELEVNIKDVRAVNMNDMNFSKCKVIKEMSGKYQKESETEFGINDIFKPY